MAQFFGELLDAFSDKTFLEKVCKKYHYGGEQLQELAAVAAEMLPLMRTEACWERIACGAAERRVQTGGEISLICPPVIEPVIMTLGAGVDTLQESYLKRGLLSEGYMIESLASELLLKGYGAYNRHVAAHTVFHVARYHFPGGEESYPLEQLPRLLEQTSLSVTCNGAYCMQPKKSVVFWAELTTEDTAYCQGICVGCTAGSGGKSCPNRIEDGIHLRQVLSGMTDVPLSYGYSRIFGRK